MTCCKHRDLQYNIKQKTVVLYCVSKQWSCAGWNWKYMACWTCGLCLTTFLARPSQACRLPGTCRSLICNITLTINSSSTTATEVFILATTIGLHMPQVKTRGAKSWFRMSSKNILLLYWIIWSISESKLLNSSHTLEVSTSLPTAANKIPAAG